MNPGARKAIDLDREWESRDAEFQERIQMAKQARMMSVIRSCPPWDDLPRKPRHYIPTTVQLCPRQRAKLGSTKGG